MEAVPKIIFPPQSKYQKFHFRSPIHFLLLYLHQSPSRGSGQVLWGVSPFETFIYSFSHIFSMEVSVILWKLENHISILLKTKQKQRFRLFLFAYAGWLTWHLALTIIYPLEVKRDETLQTCYPGELEHNP